MKNLFYAGALTLASLFTMSCTSTATTAESNVNNSNTTNIEVSSTSDTSKIGTSDAVKSIIVDVRTQGEWDNDGHAPCSTLIPLDELEKRVEELRPYGKITVVCRSGGRAGRAANYLKSVGFEDVTNAGPWQNANCE